MKKITEFLQELGFDTSYTYLIDSLKNNPERKLNHNFIKLVRTVGLEQHEQKFREYLRAESELVNKSKQVSEQYTQIIQSFQQQELHLDYKGEIDIGCTDSFTHGFKFGFNFASGEEFLKSIALAPYSISHSPISFSFEIGCKDMSLFQMIHPTLLILKDTAKDMIPELAMFFRFGLDIQFRVSENRFFVDAVVGGLLAFIVHKHFGKYFNLQNFKFSSSKGFTFQTQFSPMHLLSLTLEQLIKNATMMNFKGCAEVFNFKVLTTFLERLIDSGIVSFKDKEKKGLKFLLNAINIFKNLGFELKYDANELYNSIIDNLNSFLPNIIQTSSSKLTEMQMLVDPLVQQLKGMTMVVADFMDHIRNADFDDITLHLNLPLAKLGFRVLISLPGITQFLQGKLLPPE